MDFDIFVRARLHSLIRYAILLTGARERRRTWSRKL